MASVERGMKRKKMEETVEEENLNESDEGDRGFRSALRAMREKKEWTDVVLVCDGGVIHVHGLILAAQSPYFQNMFHNDFKESKTKLVDYSHVKKDVMLVILDYIYLNSVENIPDEDVQSLINIIQVSHQFQMKRLNERCWKLILNQINADNWLNIWELVLLYENNEEIIQTLHFILNHLSEIVKKNFFNLNRLQLVTLMEKINENNLPMEDKFLETIIEWKKKTKQKNVDFQEIFLKVNYHFISREFMNNLLENEKDLFQDTFLNFFKQHFLPTLKTYTEVQSYKKTLSPILTGNKLFSLQFFYFGCYKREYNNCILYKNAGLRIFDCEKQSVCKIIDNLPFLFGRGIFPIQHGSDIYIIGGIPSGVPEPVASETTKSFFLYDWKNNRVVEKPSLLEGIYFPTVYATENNIYVFQLDYSNDVYTIFQYYSFSEQKWFARTYTNFGVVACASVKNLMYLLCYEDNSGYYCLYTVNQLEFTFHSNTPVPYFDLRQNLHVNQRMITVYKDKVFILSNKPNHSWYIFDPNTQLWDIIGTSFECVEHTSIEFSIYCFDNGNNSLMFYNMNDLSIYQVDENNADMKKVMTVKGQLDKTCNGTYKKYEQWLFFKSSF